MLQPQRRRVKTPVTIIVGIKCEDGVVIASDCQSTYGNTKRTDVQKIHNVNFKNAECLIACAGSSAVSDWVIEKMQQLAKGQHFTENRSLADVAQEACRQFEKQLRGGFDDRPVSELEKR